MFAFLHNLGNSYLLFWVALLWLAFQVFKAVRLWYHRLLYSAIPSPPMDNFFQGHFPSMTAAKERNEFLDLFKGWCDKYGQSIVVHTSGKALFFTAEPIMFKTMSTEIIKFQKMKQLPSRNLYGQSIVGYNSILSGNGNNWAIKRKVMSRVFAKTNMGELYDNCKPVALRQIAELKTEVGSGKVLEFHDAIANLFYAFPEAMGFSGVDTPRAIARFETMILETIPKQKTEWLQYAVSQERVDTINKIKDMRSRLKAAVQKKSKELVTSRIGKNKDSGIICSTKDVFGHLVIANRKCKFKRSDSVEDLIVDDIMTIFFVTDNLVEQFTALFMDLAENPEVYQKMAAEIRGFKLRDIDSLNELKYTNNVLLESLRLTPALLRGVREFVPNKESKEKTTMLGPYSVPVNTKIIYSQYLLHRDEKIWEDPLKFKPERWENGFHPPAYTYMPFFAGSRGCLAKHFAMMVMKLQMVVLLQNFELSPRIDQKNKPYIDQGLAAMRIRNKVHYEFVPLQQIEETT